MGQQPTRKPVFPPEIAPYIDVGAYLLDSRAPAATLYLDKLLLGKELIVLTRTAQADPKYTSKWQGYLQDKGYTCLCVDSVSGEGFTSVLDYLARLLKRKQAVAAKRGITQTVLRLVALGVPNVGKSTFLNQLIGKKRFKTGNQPGITKGRQWVRLFEDVEVLDTPGVLRDPEQLNRRKPYWMLLNLMPYDAKIREQVVDLVIDRFPEKAIKKLNRFYKLNVDELREDWLSMLEAIGSARGFKVKTEDDVDRAARRLIKDFQQGRFGRITLEQPETDRITSPFFRGNEPVGDEGG